MLNSKTIEQIFYTFLEDAPENLNSNTQEHLYRLVELSIKTNWKIWHLEDSARMDEYSAQNIAEIKKKIDMSNQTRNNLIKKIDFEITKSLHVIPLDPVQNFYSETPGMVVDRLAILYIKRHIIQKLLKLITENNLAQRYKKHENMVLKQIGILNTFFDKYIKDIRHKKVYFEVQDPIKIYNDDRVKKYIQCLHNKNKR